MDPELMALMERMCRIGDLLPDIDKLDLDNDAEVAEAQMIVAELEKAREELFAKMKQLRERQHDEAPTK